VLDVDGVVDDRQIEFGAAIAQSGDVHPH